MVWQSVGTGNWDVQPVQLVCGGWVNDTLSSTGSVPVEDERRAERTEQHNLGLVRQPHKLLSPLSNTTPH